MSLRDRRIRYGAPAALIVIGFACGAISTGTVGGALATAFIAAGLILFVALLLSDLGLTDRPQPRPRVPTPTPTPTPPPSPAPPRPDAEAPSRSPDGDHASPS